MKDEAPRVLAGYSALTDANTQTTYATLLATNRIMAMSDFGPSIQQFVDDMQAIIDELVLALTGRLLNANGSPGQKLAVALVRTPVGGSPDILALATSKANGSFELRCSRARLQGSGASLRLRIGGANTVVSLDLSITLDQRQDYPLGDLALTSNLTPLPDDLIATLDGMGVTSNDAGAAGDVGPPQDGGSPNREIQVQLGDPASAGAVGGVQKPLLNFDFNKSFDQFSYSVMFRLIEPHTQALVIDPDPVTGDPRAVERVAIRKPLSVSALREGLAGLDASGVVSDTEPVRIAGSVGLGYFVNMTQRWVPEGLSLGNLVYSLPLAPGERQRIAVFEQTTMLRVQETERLSTDDRTLFTDRMDSSTQSIFESAFQEAVRAGSSFDTRASSSSKAGAGGLGLAIGPLVIGGGAAASRGSSNSSGVSTSTLDGARSSTAQASQRILNSVERFAATTRRAERTSIRLLSESESVSVTTKEIANNNRIHALTVQYWEVLRHYRVEDVLRDVTLVCFVPLEVVRFLPAGQALAFMPPAGDTRAELLARYAGLIRNADVLRDTLPRSFRQGLNLLEEFAGNPEMEVQLNSPALRTLEVTLTGWFLPVDVVWVTVLLRNGTRLAARQFPMSDVEPLPTGANAFQTRSALVEELRKRRGLGGTPDGTLKRSLTATVPIPESIEPEDVVGFEIGRRLNTLVYTLKPTDEEIAKKALEAFFEGKNVDQVLRDAASGLITDMLKGVVIGASELEQVLGGPLIEGFGAEMPAIAPAAAIPYTPSPPPLVMEPLPAQPYPIAALRVKPRLRFEQVMAIEKMLVHVVRNTADYSRAVWLSMSAEERAMLLEGYEIVLGESPRTTAPLLNCVGNELLGFMGNCMILAFSVPARLTQPTGTPATAERLTSARIERAIAEFHRIAFEPRRVNVALPTDGVLCEAVLGSMPSAEKIDVTRFWNWKDAELSSDSTVLGNLMTAITSRTPANALGTLATAPTELKPPDSAAALTALLGANTLPTSLNTDQVAALIKFASDKSGFTAPTLDAALMTQAASTLSTAEGARKGALDAAKGILDKMVDKLPEIIKADKAKSADDASQTQKQQKLDEEKKDKDTQRSKDATELLKRDAPTFISQVLKMVDALPPGATPGEKRNRAAAMASRVVSSATGGAALPPHLALALRADYAPTVATPENEKIVKEAFLRALGLELEA
jgi:hypothetical protein